MPLPLRELRHRYKVLRATRDALPRGDLGFDAAISTGSKVLDSMLLEKIATTQRMNAAAHLVRSWALTKAATSHELDVCADIRAGILRDHLELLALQSWDAGDFDSVSIWLEALPVKWRVLFPLAAIKPASVFLEGWRGDLSFRLVNDPRFPRLREWFRELLQGLGPVPLIKYRAHLRAAAAMLRFRFEGPRERAIHDWCFGGDALGEIPELEGARRAAALFEGGRVPTASELEAVRDPPIPLTYFLGLVSGVPPAQTSDTDGAAWWLLTPSVWKNRSLLDYAIHAATPVECVLHLRAWSEHLTEEDVRTIASKVVPRVDEDGAGSVPFDKVCTALVRCPPGLKKQLVDPLFIPLLARWGERLRGLLPVGDGFNMVQPAAFANPMSFLFYAALLSGGGSGRLILLGGARGRAAEVTDLDAAKARDFLVTLEEDLPKKLIEFFGGVAMQRSYGFDPTELREALDRLPPDRLTVLDMPFCFHPVILQALRRYDYVLNIGGYFGAPGELPLNPGFFERLFIRSGFDLFGYYYRARDNPLPQLVSFVDRLKWVSRASEAVT